MLEKLEAEFFKKFVNDQFLIHFEEDKALEAELIKVEELAGDTELDRKPFFLTFETNQKDQYYLQSIYKVSHPDLDDLHLFIVPSGRSKEGMLYEVIFS